MQDMRQVQPSSDFCQVCRVPYADYFGHIAEPSHSKLLRQSIADRYINQLCASSSKNHPISKKPKALVIPKERPNSRKVRKKQAAEQAAVRRSSRQPRRAST
jgi:hypothetical protein